LIFIKPSNGIVHSFKQITACKCRVRIKYGQVDWTIYAAIQRFDLPSNSSFEIEAPEAVDYVCYFG
jgi:hypothetical protein